MKPINFLTAISLVLGTSLTSYAQVGMGTATPAASSVFDLASTTPGLLVPRMTATQRAAIIGLSFHRSRQSGSLIELCQSVEYV